MASNDRPSSVFTDFDRWGIYQRPTVDGHKGTRLNFGWQTTAKGNIIPRISVNTGNPDDEPNGFIGQGFQIEQMYIMLDILEKVALGEPTPRPYICENYRGADPDENGSFNREKILATKFAIGKDADGMVWFGLTSEGRTKRKIDIVMNEYHRLQHPDGTPFSAAEGSKLQALAMVRGLRAAYDSIAAKERPPFNGGNRKNNAPQGEKSAASRQAESEFEGLDL